jgi:hypothetical protein
MIWNLPSLNEINGMCKISTTEELSSLLHDLRQRARNASWSKTRQISRLTAKLYIELRKRDRATTMIACWHKGDK